MTAIDYYIVDVFAKQKYQGNQLAVFIDFENKLNQSQMLQMAKEINFAETTFIKKKLSDNKYAVKIFTTESEIPFAGHPTIGTSYVIAKFLQQKPTSKITLSLIDREIQVDLSALTDLDSCLFKMTQSQPEFLKSFKKSELDGPLKLDTSIIRDDAPIQEVTTGLPYIIVPVTDLKSMERLDLNAKDLNTFLIDKDIYISEDQTKLSTSLFFYTSETYEAGNDFNTRMFCLEDKILKEDSATGSANGCFLAYLLKFQKDTIKANVEQGFQMNRKSYLFLEGERSDNSYVIKVGGYSKMVSAGKWFV